MDRVFIIAEAGVNHNGDYAIAKQLIDVAKEAGADAVKFQTFSAEDVCHANAPKAEYQQANAKNKKETQLEMLKSLEMSIDNFAKLKSYAEKMGLEFFSTAFDKSSQDDLVAMGMRKIKIASGELTNLPFIAHAARKNLPIILSTGMGTMEEVKEAVSVITANHKEGNNIATYLSLLHCTSNYPTDYEAVNLKAIQTLKQQFECPVGYSDHTRDVVAAPCAVALGATIIEKHFTLDRNMDGPDHRASLEPQELCTMVAYIRAASVMLIGGGVKTPRESEKAVAAVARRSVILLNNKKKGEKIFDTDVSILRPGTGIPPKFKDRIIGQEVTLNLSAGTPLKWDHIICGKLS